MTTTLKSLNVERYAWPARTLFYFDPTAD